MSAAPPFPPSRNHLRFAELTEATDLFFLETWTFESHYTGRRVRENDLGVTLLFLTDDWIDKQPHGKGVGLSGRITSIVRGATSPTAGSPVEEMLNQIFRAIAGSAEAEQFRDVRVPSYIAQYLDFRCYNSGNYFALALARYALNTYLTDDELHHLHLLICERLALGVILVALDVVSYEKEAGQNTPGNNLIARLFRHGTDGHTFTSTSAVKGYLRECIANSEAQFRDGISVALADGILGTSDASGRLTQLLPDPTKASIIELHFPTVSVKNTNVRGIQKDEYCLRRVFIQ
ncbi:hypothetical protein DFH08DRAFT_985831 [Mycena albidolilacea]|uniref:Uncharacterized protein n=1 Tax=Mycena albidolilacea TaxID=1033008 RepID=A0AAD6Z289_9AGAR|nr:hypothetical protein DFH08DRAFT_985831 [Mycena albidolilacea]